MKLSQLTTAVMLGAAGLCALAQSPVFVPARVDSPTCGFPTTAHADSPAWRQRLLLQVQVTASGEITNARVRQSSGDAAFNERVLDAARNCRAQAATQDGKAVDSTLTLEIKLWDPWAGRPTIVANPSCTPIYPAESIRLEQTGTTVMRYTIDARGEPIETDIESSSGYPLLDQAAADALRRCTFRPARDANGQPVAARLSITFVWKLQ